MNAGEIRAFVLIMALLVLAADWAGFVWGEQHRDAAFVVAQLGFFMLAHALYTKERK